MNTFKHLITVNQIIEECNRIYDNTYDFKKIYKKMISISK